MDDNYQVYINRVAPMTLDKSHQQQLPHIQKSAKFEQGKPLPFPGYTVVTPPGAEDEANQGLYEHLEQCQRHLESTLGRDLMVTVPPSSFHLTIADLIWNSNYQQAVAANPDFESQLRDRIGQSFDQYRSHDPTHSPVQFQVFGLTLFPRAIVVCLVPRDELGYNRLVNLRRAIYQNPGLIALGIEQQYYFTAHITLGYFGEGVAKLDGEHLVQTLAQLNEQWLGAEPQILSIERAELRKFDDMNRYYRESDWQIFSF